MLLHSLHFFHIAIIHIIIISILHIFSPVRVTIMPINDLDLSNILFKYKRLMSNFITFFFSFFLYLYIFPIIFFFKKIVDWCLP